MALRRMAASMLSRTFAAGRAAAPLTTPPHAGSGALLAAWPPAQLTSLQRILCPSATHSGGVIGGRAFSTDYEQPPMGLREAVKAELDYEHDNYEAPEDLSRPPAPWTVTETPGDAELTLTRQYNGETVEVFAQANGEDDNEGNPLEGMPPAAEGEDHQIQDEMADAIDVGISATARVTKGNRSIEISFNTDGEHVTVFDVSLGPPDVKDDDETAYSGPRFEELDETVQRAFDVYLEERGIDAEFGEWLMKALTDKEQREYVDWLQKVHDFASS